MPPPKKAAKKAAKKSAKHPDQKHHAGHHEANDLRRAYEHLGRVESLERTLPGGFGEAVSLLKGMAQAEINAGHAKDAADLLRGAEHLSFAALAGESARDHKLVSPLPEAIAEKFDELNRRADEHWNYQEERPEVLTVLYQSARKGAVKAYKASHFFKALEFARAAEALAHVKSHASLKLTSGSESGKRLLELAV